MTRFTVYVPYIVTLAVRGVEAEDEDDALNKVEGHASLCAYCATELDLSPDANWEDATAEEEMVTDYQRCGAERQPLRIGNQAEQRPRCEARHGHDGPHRAGVLDSDDNPITVRWRDT